MWAVATRVRPDLDIDIIPRIAGERLDPTAYDETGLKTGNMASKMIIDATKPLNSPFPSRIAPPKKQWKSIKLENYIKDYRKSSSERS